MNPPLLLLVDDYQDAREMYAEYLTLIGFRVLQAKNGEEALVVAAEQQPDVILMDLGLPGLDGREAIKRLRASPQTAHIKVVILSGMPPEVARAAQADAFVGKPCPPETLVAEIRRVLEKS